MRDRHKSDTIQRLLMSYQIMSEERSKCVVWAHNSHGADSRATVWPEKQEQKVRQMRWELFGSQNCLIVGFSTFSNTMQAAASGVSNARCWSSTRQCIAVTLSSFTTPVTQTMKGAAHKQRARYDSHYVKASYRIRS